MPVIPSSSSNVLPRADLYGAALAMPIPWSLQTLRAFLPVGVRASSGSYIRYDAAEISRSVPTARAANAGYNRPTLRLGEDSFRTAPDGAEHPIDDGYRADLRANMADAMIDGTISSILLHRVLLQREINACAAIFNTTTWPLSGNTGHTASVLWTSPATSAPLTDVINACSGLKARSGLAPDTMAIPYSRWLSLWAAASVRGGIIPTMLPKIPDPKDRAARRALAEQLTLKDIIVFDSVTSPADESGSTLTASAGTDYAFVFYRGYDPDTIDAAADAVMAGGSSPLDVLQPTCLRAYLNESDGGWGEMEEYREDATRSSVLRFRGNLQLKVVDPNLGYLIKVA